MLLRQIINADYVYININYYPILEALVRDESQDSLLRKGLFVLKIIPVFAAL